MSLKLCLLFMCIYSKVCFGKDPACETTKLINDWKRSVKYTPQVGDLELCDNFIEEGWYRITSKVGDKMPTSCPKLGFKCCTTNPLWLSDEKVPKGDDLYPKVNDVVDRIACASSFDGNCCKQKIPIKIKNCGTYLVYHLTPPKECNTAYCFGDKLPCPAGQSSETGFPPGCGTYPNVKVKPTVETDIAITKGLNNNSINYTFEKVQFKCKADGLDPKYTCNVRWYINDFPIDLATKKDIQSSRLNEAVLRQDDWDKTFKPNMKVKCSLQIKQAGFTSPGPEQMSADFFAGFIVHQKEYTVEEGKTVQVPVQLTIPIGCSYPTMFPRFKIETIKEKSCVLNLLTSIPMYQENPNSCQHGLNRDSLTFNGQKCGIYFSNKSWKTQQTITVTGAVDNIVNFEDRVTALRLYHDINKVKTSVDELDFWRGVMLEDIKFRIKDKDEKLLGNTCTSNNDPHMSTFEGMVFSFHRTEGEYLLYRNIKLPVEVHAYYRKCGHALCNCGAAIRSGNSAFVANFCTVKDHQNRYVAQKICNKHEMEVKQIGLSYRITTMSGSEIHISLYQWSQHLIMSSITIKASEIDRDATEGICGTLDGDKLNDLTPKGSNRPIPQRRIIEEIAASWRIIDQKESLFNIYAIKQAEFHPQQYCTCEKKTQQYPYGDPEINCELKASLKLCIQMTIPKSIYKVSCRLHHLKTRKRRSATTRHEIESIVQEDDDAPEMYLMDITEGEESNVNTQWKNGWNAVKARDYCDKQFKQSTALSVCSDNVPSVPSDSYLNECIEDIKVTGDTSWSDVSVSNFESACFNEAVKIENLTRTNSTDGSVDTKTIFQIIAEVTCPHKCSGHGRCENGLCNCTHNYFGSACEKERSEAPDILTDGFDGLCDISSRPCKKYVIPGLNFMEGTLKCKYRHVWIELNETIDTGIIELVDGEYSSLFSMKCPAPSSRHRRSTNPKQSAVGYFVSVSNDGKNFTKEIAIIIFDSACFECNTTTMTCDEVLTCPKTNPVKEKSHTAAYVGAGFGGAAAVVAILVMLLVFKKKLHKWRSSIKDSTLNLPDKNDAIKKPFAYGTIESK